MFTIRILEEKDSEEYLRLRLEALQDSPNAFGSAWEDERSQTPESVKSRLRAVPNGNFVVGAFAERKLIGMVGFRRYEGRKEHHKGFIWGVYVTSSERRKGVAAALFQALLERIRTYEGLEQAALSVAETQKGAQKLYASLGFEVFGYERRALKIGENYVDEEHRVLWLRTPPVAIKQE